MQQLALIVALAALSAPAFAVDLVIVDPVVSNVQPSAANGGFNPNGSALTGFVASNGTIGTLAVTGAGIVSFTYLGKEAGNTNFFASAQQQINTGAGTTNVGSSILLAVDAPGALTFKFGGVGAGPTAEIANGAAANGNRTFTIFSGGNTGFKYVLGFDDIGAGLDRDFDDMTIGVNVSAVPEPETYALMLGGLAALVFFARRRQPPV